MTEEMRLMTKAGKTFYFATLWLSDQARNDAAVAYSFCRKIDDVADGGLPEEQRDEYLRSVARAVRACDAGFPGLGKIVSLIERFPEIKGPLAALVDACREDTADLFICNESDVERYSHGVAGNVGLIMYPILGGVAPEGRSFAADLGIAMQCTNIARDVLEDLRRNRVYLPAEWLGGVDVRHILLGDPIVERRVVEAVQRLLGLARARYERGLSGLEYLEPRSRYAIKVAARCYQAIGDRVIRNGELARARAVVPFYEKLLLACRESITRAPRQVSPSLAV